jgi:methyltransferase-like protein/2-polyprenyl-3-methyl-5-hydroxy-6-metoxy-1,4-benzoquinol methylase
MLDMSDSLQVAPIAILAMLCKLRCGAYGERGFRMAEVTQQSSYDEVPYESNPIAQTHPNRTAVIARLLGLRVAALDKCRVLELGCSTGGNLLPMAEMFPASQFIGLDLSPVQIEMARRDAEGAGVRNVEFIARSILDVNAELGKFDYIIVHGVYSWVPAPVRAKILEICSTNLAPNGVAQVSYNTYPGWHMREIVRDAMRYHASRFATPETQVQQARAILDFLAETVGGDSSAYGKLLNHEVQVLRRSQDYYLLHEHLEEVNHPIYFHQFAAQAAEHGLQYVGDADFQTMLTSNLPAGAAAVLCKVAPDLVAIEQYMDFVRNRTFRRTLLTHNGVALQRNITPAPVKDMFVSSSAEPLSPQPNIRAADFPEMFRSERGSASLVTPICKAAMMVLREHYPQPLHFDKLRRLARRKLSPAKADSAKLAGEDADALARDLLQAFGVNIIDLYVYAPPIQCAPSARPVVSPLVRWQAPRGWVTSQLHGRVECDSFARLVVTLLDGTRDRTALEVAMLEKAKAGELVYHRDGKAVTEDGLLRQIVAEGVEQMLNRFARAALLVG